VTGELRREQLEAIVSRAGERLKEHRVHPGGRYTLELPGGHRLTLLTYESPTRAETARAALELLRAEVDLPIPLVRAGDTSGQVAPPWLLTSELPGEPLGVALPRIPEGELYKLGRRLGDVAYRVHRVACDRFGALAGPDPAAADDERGYVLARVEVALDVALGTGHLDERDAETVRSWFAQGFNPAGGQAALVCGGLTPEGVLVRQSGGSWSISALTEWEWAHGWSPAWEHTLLFDAFDGSRAFGLRVGYGNAYDMATRRAYEQVREAALRPYRALLSLERLGEAAGADVTRLRTVLLGLISFKDG
jgi:hypothetical protein